MVDLKFQKVIVKQNQVGAHILELEGFNEVLKTDTMWTIKYVQARSVDSN